MFEWDIPTIFMGDQIHSAGIPGHAGLSGYGPGHPVISSSSKPLAMPGPREPETPSVPCTCGQKREWPGPHHLTTCKMWEAGK